MIDSNDRYRMGVLGDLLPLPLEDSPIQDLDEFAKSWIHVRPEVIRLLQKRGIDVHTISVLYRSLPTRPQSETKTILIVATASMDPDPWMIFLEDCYAFLVDGLGAQNLKIEIIDPRVLNGKTCFPVTIDHPICGQWPSLRRRFHQELRSEKWQSLQVLKRGYMIAGEIPAVSIVVTMQDVFDLRWNATLERLQDILNEPLYETLDVKLHLIQGAVALRAQAL